MTLHRILLVLFALLVLGRVVFAQVETPVPSGEHSQSISPPTLPPGIIITPVEGSDTAPEPAVDPEHAVVRLVKIKYRDELLLDLENRHHPLYEIKPFLQDAIMEIRPVPSIHAFLIKAKDEESIDIFEQLISFLDKDTEQVLLHLTLVKLTMTEAAVLAEESIKIFEHYTGQYKNQLQQKLDNYLKAGKAEVIDTAQVMIEAGGEATFNFSTRQPGIPPFNIGTIAHPNDELTLSVKLQSDTIPAGAWPCSLRVYSHTTYILASGLPIGDNVGAKDRTTGMIFITATYCHKWDGYEITIPPLF